MPIISTIGLGSAPINDLLDKGRYLVNIVSAEPVTSLRKGTPGIKLEFVVLQGPIQATGVDPVGRHVFWTLWLPQSGAGNTLGLTRLAQLCTALGLERGDQFDTDTLVDKTLVVRLGVQKTDEGDEQQDVKGFYYPAVLPDTTEGGVV